jgi:ribonuclease HI
MNTVVYTDGSCINNGRPTASAGIGVFFGHKDPRNYSGKILGKQTNNTAELKAILKAIELLREDIMNGDNIVIYSDSSYAIRCCTDYGEKLHKLDWNKKIPNATLVKEAFYTCSQHPNVTLKYIRAHTGLQDIHSIGNENADSLATRATGAFQDSSESRGHTSSHNRRTYKIYVNVPYSEKEAAKQMNLKWDYKRKKWYMLNTNSNKEDILRVWNMYK